MKPSERIQELANKFREENKRIDSWKIGIDAIVTYLDEQAELLETHTVKEDGYKWDLPKLKELGMKVKKAMEEPTTPEKKIHTKPMKKCKICKMDYCPECFEFCHMCPRPSVSECHQGESEKRNDVY